MIERMLIPLDGSRAAEAVLGRATALLKAARGTAVLLHVVAPAADGVKEECHRAHEYLSRVAKRLYLEKVSVLTQVVIGEPAREILRAALEEEADLVAMTSHGRGGPLGSVAGRVLRASRTPVLLVPAGSKAGGNFRHILLRLDGGVEAAAVVGSLAEGTRAKVVLVQTGKGRGVLARALDVMTRLEIPATVRGKATVRAGADLVVLSSGPAAELLIRGGKRALLVVPAERVEAARSEVGGFSAT